MPRSLPSSTAAEHLRCLSGLTVEFSRAAKRRRLQLRVTRHCSGSIPGNLTTIPCPLYRGIDPRDAGALCCSAFATVTDAKNPLRLILAQEAEISAILAGLGASETGNLPLRTITNAGPCRSRNQSEGSMWGEGCFERIVLPDFLIWDSTI